MNDSNSIVMNLQAGVSFPRYTNKHEEREDKKRRLVAGFRIFAEKGFDMGGAGHISLRDPILTDHFWVNPLLVSFAQITTADLLLVNSAGQVVQGEGLLNGAAFTIHSKIHELRPEVEAAAHAHSVYGRTWSTLGRALDPITQDACAFYQDHVVFNQYSGVVLDEDEGIRIAQLMGRKKACILQNHGLLTVGTSLDAALWWFILMESCCQTQLMAEAVAKPILIPEQDALKTRKVIGNEIAGWFSFQNYYKQVIKQQDV
ncbi:MAG: class II aldolase/adducin family protein [Gammaproteobacteria bacterium]|nr:class II aldolase/adducin family protein [Gammaproteobacteria bacterium]